MTSLASSKIVIDARELNGTGTGTYLKHLLSDLQQIDDQHSYIVLLRPKDMDDWKPSNKRFTKVACRFKEFTFGEQLGLWRQLHKIKPDLVHFGMVQQPIGYQGKVVTTMNDLTTARFRNPAKNWLIFTIKQQVYKLVNYIVAHKSAHLITYTEFVKDDVARYANINSRKITVTHLAADEITDKPEEIPELDGKDFIMYVGSSHPHKNLDRLVDAFILLRQDNPQLRLVLAGKRNYLFKRLEKRVAQKGAGNVIFTGFVSEGQLRWLYEHTAAYVFPSLSEGFGLPGLEAMMHGAPVVSSSATCLPEVYQDGALYFDPLDANDMAEKINAVVNDEKLAHSLVQKGKKVAASYSWQHTAEQTLAVYKEVLGE